MSSKTWSLAIVLCACSLERAPEAPLLVAPITGDHTGRSQETIRFSWSAPQGGADYYRLEVSEEPDFFFSSRTVNDIEELFADVDFLLPESTPRGRLHFWRVLACNDEDACSVSPSRSVHVGSAERDFNGDGYSDVLVGAPSGAAAKIYVHFGSSAGLSLSPAGVLSGDIIQGYGRAASWAGDVNDDGFADILVGSPSALPGGSVRLYYGGPGSSFNTTSDWSVSGQGDEQLGYSVAPAGDVNGDGVSDIVVGAYKAMSSSGRVYVFFGRQGGGISQIPDRILEGAALERLGISVAAAGDVDNDGLSDILVGTSEATAPGYLYVYFGDREKGLRSERTRIDGIMNGDRFGSAFATAGDIDADGVSDLVVSSGGNSLVHVNQWHFQRTLIPSHTGSSYGISVSSAGDVDGDGFDDFLVGESDFDGIGAALVYFGGAPQDEIGVRWLGNWVASGEFGTAVAPAGDINADGFDDFLVGAPNTGQGGQAYVYYGAETFIGMTFDVLSGTSAGENLGEHVGK